MSDKITNLRYVDDLLLIIHDVPSAAAQHMLNAKAELDMFSIAAGISVNVSKSAILLKGSWDFDSVVSLGATNLPIKDRCRYLGVLIGHVAPEVAYGAAIQKGLKYLPGGCHPG